MLSKLRYVGRVITEILNKRLMLNPHINCDAVSTEHRENYLGARALKN